MSLPRRGRRSTASTTFGSPVWHGTAPCVLSTPSLLPSSSKLVVEGPSSSYQSARFGSPSYQLMLKYIICQSITLKASVVFPVIFCPAKSNVSAALIFLHVWRIHSRHGYRYNCCNVLKLSCQLSSSHTYTINAPPRPHRVAGLISPVPQSVAMRRRCWTSSGLLMMTTSSQVPQRTAL